MGEITSFVRGRQLPSPEHSRGSGGSGEPIEAFGKLQDRFPCARIRKSGNPEPNRAPKADRQKQCHDERCSWGEPWDRIAWRCIRVKSPRMTAGGNSGV